MLTGTLCCYASFDVTCVNVGAEWDIKRDFVKTYAINEIVYELDCCDSSGSQILCLLRSISVPDMH